MIESPGDTTEAEVTLMGLDENGAEILEGLEDPFVTNMSVEHDVAGGTVDVQIDVTARGVTLEPRGTSDMDELETEKLPVYEADANWGVGRVNTEEWDVGLKTAKTVYESLIDKVSAATKAGSPSIVVVGKPQYKALWVYVTEVHAEAENPEQLVPLKMVVVPGPMLHVDQRNLDVLYDTHD